MTARTTAAALAAAVTLSLSACSDAHTAEADPHHVDVAFAQMMIPHHADAIAMSQALLEVDGIDAPVRDLATSIVRSQTDENARMNDWLADRELERVDASVPVIGADDLAAVPTDQVRDAFLRQMSVHHEHGVMMARRVVTGGRSPEMVELAATMVEVQSAEIEQIGALLSEHPTAPEDA